MLTVDDFLPMIGNPLDERLIEQLCGQRGLHTSDELDPGHPEDQRHYYELRSHSLEMILGDGEIVRTIFFHLRGKQAGFPWRLRNRLDGTSSRQAVLAALGTPGRSGRPNGPNGCVGFDRFRVGGALLHFSYGEDERGVNLVTAMLPAFAP